MQEAESVDKERYKVLSECLVLMEAQKRMMSKNQACQIAKDGYEQAFEDVEQNICVLRAMLREVRYGS